MERQAQARPLGSINPPPHGTCTGPAPSPGKRDSVGRSVVAISERELSLASVLSPLRQCPGHAAPVTMSSERPRSPWEGGCQNRCRERDQDWYLSLCCSLAACWGWKVFSDVWEGANVLCKLSACWREGNCAEEGSCRAATGLGLRELLISLGFSCFPLFCQIPLGPGGC